MSKNGSKKCRKILFSPARFIESSEDFSNPDRGWYQIHTFKLGEPVDMTDREYALNNTDSLAFVLIDIGAYKERPLDDVAIDGLNKIFTFFRNYRLDMIVRVVYDTIGDCLKTEPDDEQQIISHIDQLVEVMENYKDRIFVYQGLLIGNWGEMHSSKFLSPARLQRLSAGLVEKINDTAYLAVRRPAYVRIMFPEGQDTVQSKVGIYDDAILASPTHLGTFGEKPAKEVRREQSWIPQEEIEYVSALCDRVPYGGEALWSDEKDSISDARSSVSGMAKYFSKLHLTYLNRVHDVTFIEKLKKMKYKGLGVYRGMTGYEYMSVHLGYRLVLRDVCCRAVNSDREQLRWDVTVENVGFARPFLESGCVMDAFDEYGNRIQFDVSEWFDIKQVPAGGKHTFVCMTPYVTGAVYLRFFKASTGQAIHFANKGQKNVSNAILLGNVIVK